MRRLQLLRTGVLIVAVALLSSACGADGGSSGAPPTSVAPTAPPAEATTTTTLPVDITAAPEKPAPTTAPPPSDGTLPPAVDPGTTPAQAAIADLAAMLNVDVGTIDVVMQEEVVWRDGSIGCPQPGMSYTQALVDGTRIVLEHDGTRYEYHSGGGRDPFYCADPAE